MRFRILSTRLRTRLVLIAAIAVLPALVVIAYNQSVERRRARERILEDNLRFLRLAASQQAAAFPNAQRFLHTLAQIPGLRARDPDECNRVLPTVLHERPGYISLTVVNTDGTLFCSSASEVESLRLEDRPWLHRVMRGRTASVHVYHGATGKPGVGVGYPLLGSTGDVERVLMADLDLKLGRLARLVSSVQLPRGATLTLFDRNRTIYDRYPDSAQWIGQQLPESVALQQLFAGVREPIAENIGVDGVPRVYVAVPVEDGFGTGLYLGLGIERSAVFAEADRILREQIVLLGVVLLAVMGAALIGGDAFVLRPVNALRSVTDRLAAGDLSARSQLTSGVQELNALGDAVDSMAMALETRQRERDQAEQELGASEHRYRLLFDQNPLPMWVYDLATLQFLEVNDSAVQHYGYSRDEFLAMRITDIRPPEDVPRLLDKVGESHESWEQPETWRHLLKSGQAIDVAISSHSLEFAGRPARLVLAQDVTERRALEDQLRQAQKMEAIGKLAGGVAHDFNNMLTAILGYAELLSQQIGSDKPIGRDLREIVAAAQRAADLTRQLLAFSRKQTIRPIALSLNAVIEDLEPMLRRLISAKIGIRTSLDPNTYAVLADSTQLEQVLMNLVINARDAMPDGGTLVIGTWNATLREEDAVRRLGAAPGDYAVLSVADTGIGMTPEVQKRIFEPFYTTKERGRGTGLGLAAVYGIAKQLGGNIWVYSEPGHGTVFKIYLPKTDLAPQTITPPDRSAATVGREAILLVEDETAVRSFAQTVLVRHGYHVLEAESSEAALARLGGHDGVVDLLLTDVMLSGMDGGQLARHLRRDRPALRVLFMSGYADPGVALPPDAAVLEKPFTAHNLLSRVRLALAG